MSYLFDNKKIYRAVSLSLCLLAIMNMTGCSIKNKIISKEKVLVGKTDDVTTWVEEDSTASNIHNEKVYYEDVSSNSSVNDTVNNEDEVASEKTLTQEEIEAGYIQKQSEFIRDVSVQKPIYQYGDAFSYASGLTTYGVHHTYDRDDVTKSIVHYNLPVDSYNYWTSAHKNVSEWGWTFFLTTPDGLGQMTGQGGFNPIPTTRNAAIAQLKKWMISSYGLINVLDVGFEANSGHYPWTHYAAEFGANCVNVELGESISSPQTRIAFARGAARQYGIAWASDFSYWYNNLCEGHLIDPPDNIGVNYGHTHNMGERIFMISFLGGASWFQVEDPIGHAFWEEGRTADGYYRLTDSGKMMQKTYAFSQKLKDVGINYIPFGILMDREHGMYTGDTALSKKKAFQVFDYTAADDMNVDIMQMFFPNTNVVMSGQENTFFANGPYGDSCDVILQNSSQKVLNSYPCLIMSGDLSDASTSEKKRYVNYVKQGGTLVMNSAYLPLFPDYAKQYSGSGRCDITDEKGIVIIYGGDYDISMLPDIVEELEAKFMPFKVDGSAEYLVNIKNGSLLVAVINSQGVFKPHDREGWIDDSYTSDVKVTYNGKHIIKSVKEIYENEKVTLSGKSVSTTLKPGAIRVYEFNFG